MLVVIGAFIGYLVIGAIFGLLMLSLLVWQEIATDKKAGYNLGVEHYKNSFLDDEDNLMVLVASIGLWPIIGTISLVYLIFLLAKKGLKIILDNSIDMMFKRVYFPKEKKPKKVKDKNKIPNENEELEDNSN